MRKTRKNESIFFLLLHAQVLVLVPILNKKTTISILVFLLNYDKSNRTNSSDIVDDNKKKYNK